MGSAALRRGSKSMPESMRAIGRVSSQRRKRKADRPNGGAEIEAEESDISYVPLSVVV